MQDDELREPRQILIMQDYAGLCRMFSNWISWNSESPTSSHPRTMSPLMLQSGMMSSSNVESCQSGSLVAVHE